MALGDEKHVARAWVEENFPSATGSAKGALILAYGAGMDRGMAEAWEAVVEVCRNLQNGTAPGEVSTGAATPGI